MKISSIPSAQLTVESCRAYGIKHIIISPGSRSAPLALSFTSHSDFECHSVVDERSAAFFALGIAQQLKAPVALLCTSGSAVLNYLPAIAEAYYSRIPLLVLSADRPTYRIDIGDGQTIEQEQVMAKFTSFSGALVQDVSHATESILMSNRQQLLHSEEEVKRLQPKQIEANIEILHQALSKLWDDRLPVHLNIPFEEPLYHLKTSTVAPIQKRSSLLSKIDQNKLDELQGDYSKANRVLILVGVLEPNDSLREHIQKLAQRPDTLVFSESLSNLKLSEAIENIDVLIAPLEIHKNSKDYFEKLQPEVLITLGGLVVSKKIKNFLRKYPPQKHYHLGNTPAYDTYFSGVHALQGELEKLLSTLNPTLDAASTYRLIGQQHLKRHQEKHLQYVKKLPFSDFHVFYKLWKKIPNNYQLHLSNSSTVRYAQLFDSKPLGLMFCNRGTSGIDGSISTALGAAQVNNSPTLCITGDLSFFYDSNALWKKECPSDMRIIIINNQGGGIFRILPETIKDRLFETYFETQHQLQAKYLARMHGWGYSSAKNSWQLDGRLKRFFKCSQRPKILEIFTPNQTNPKILSSYFKYLAQH